ncbi:MAG: hypothetical protein F4Z48_03575 [Dehalococcoidia bacterium]|nr:hypothetical protein [Dehalococcoidia bacterium]
MGQWLVRFACVVGSVAAHDEIDAAITAWTRERSHYEVMHTLQAAGVNAAPCLDPHELLEDQGMADRDLYVEMDHPEVGPRKISGLPGRYSDIEAYDYGPAPLFGQHSEEVCTGLLGLSTEEYEQLVAEEVIW